LTDLPAFHNSVKKGDLDAVRAALTESPALLDMTNEAGQNALLLSKYYNRTAIAEYLLSLKPKLDIYTAAAVGATDFVVQELSRDPALIGSHSSDGWTPLHVAAFFGQLEIAAILIGSGAEIDARSTNAMKNTPLHAAAAGRKTALAGLLLTEGANAMARQEGGWTALHAAAQNGDRDLVEMLLANGADPAAEADNHQTALDLARLKGHGEVADLLEQLMPPGVQ
jgi:uncharacterized protein